MWKSKYVTLAAAMALAVVATFTLVPAEAFAAAVPAAADTGSTFTFKWGQYASEALIALGSAGVYIAGAAIGLLPGPARWAANTFKLDQVIGKSIAAAANELAAKIATKSYTADVRSELLAQTLRNVEQNAASLAKKYAGTLRIKVQARIEEYINARQAEG